MTRVGISSNINNFPDNNDKVKVEKKVNPEIAPKTFIADQGLNIKKNVVSENPFEKTITSNKNNDLVNLEKSLKTARENNNPQCIFNVAKIQHEKGTLPNIKASDLLKEAYELALSEMDSDTLYDIGNFDAQHNLLKDVSSEHIFKMADMTRKIY